MDAHRCAGQTQVMARLTVRIDFKSGTRFGPGKARLLEAIAAEGSIRKAAASLDMSYRRAWLLVKSVEKTLGAPVLVVTSGGAKGGGATLTKAGREMAARYRRIEARAVRAAAKELAVLEKMTAGKSAAVKPRAAVVRNRTDR
jgi:molybdate transport system regulatory protein